MKVYLVAHGTMDGYEQYPKQTEYSDIPKSIYDIRAELDSSGDFLSKPLGYYIQMDRNGVWGSIIKLMRDGESDGNRPGFFAISAFIPVNCSIPGSDLKKRLDSVMSQYLNLYTNGMRTRSIGVDWSFVTKASAELNTLCQPRRKAINTNYVPSEQFAYVPVTTEEQIIQYLDKPFQPEYGQYKAVFLGTYLQHPMRLPQQTRLDIDLENEVYDIIWRGNVQGGDNLPKSVRKKDIESGSYTFKKEYYHPYLVEYSSGCKDDVNATLTLNVPILQPEINKLTLQYNHSEAVVQVVASVQSHTICDNSISNVLEFSGEEFACQTRIHLSLKDGYRCDDIVLIPSKCTNNIFFVTITKMQQISLQILEHSENKTAKYQSNIKISRSGQTFFPKFDSATSSLYLSIQENEDFVKEYSVSLIDGAYYSLNGLSKVQEGFYRVNIYRKQNTAAAVSPLKPQPRSIYLVCKDISKIKVYYDNSPCSIINNRIEIPFAGTRDKITVTFGNKKLKFKKIEKNTIKISSPLLGLHINGNVKLVLIGVATALILLVGVLFALQITGTIDIKTYFAQTEKEGKSRENREEETSSKGPTVLPTDTISEDQRLYDELDSILKNQREVWHYNTITTAVSKYSSTSVVETTHIAHALYKELAWMQCRKRIDGYLFDDNTGKWIPYKNHKAFSKKGKLINSWIFGIQKYGINSDNKTYATPQLMDFLKEIVNAPDAKQKQFFEKHVKTRNVEELNFHQVKELWDNFQVESVEPEKNATGSNQDIGASPSGIQDKQDPPAGEQSENF